MTLEQMMKMYEAEMEEREQKREEYIPVIPRKLMLKKEEKGIVLDLRDKFSLMFWRLYPSGAVVSGLDCDRPNAARLEDKWSPNQDLHRHNYLEISYVYRGSLCQEINGVEHTFHEGDVWIQDHNCSHVERRVGYDCFVVFFEIYAEFFDEMFSQAFTGNPAGEFIKEALTEKRNENRFIHFVADKPIPEVERIFNYALEERERDLPGSEYVIKGLFISLFAILAANYRFSVTEKEQKQLSDQVYQEVESYLRANCHNISLENLAKTFYVNKTYMSRMIQSGSGKSYKELLQDIRLERAAEQLTTTANAVSAIANEVGYQNVSYFYRLFQEKYQMTPNEYRSRFSLQA